MASDNLGVDIGIVIAMIKAIAGKGSSSVPGEWCGNVKQDTTAFPTQRIDGNPLQPYDYVKADRGAEFPFTVESVVFENRNDVAVFNGADWELNPSAFQNTREVPLVNKLIESLSGSANNQKEVNVEIVEKIKEIDPLIVIAEENQTINDYSVPKLTEENLTNIYNAQIAGRQVVILDATENFCYAPKQVDTDTDGIFVCFDFCEVMMLNYHTTADGVETTYKEFAAETKVDNEKIEYNEDEELTLKDHGVTKVKIDPNAKVTYTDDTQTLKNKTINADNNTISDLETDNLKTGVLDTDIDNTSTNTQIPSAKAVYDYVEGQETDDIELSDSPEESLGGTSTNQAEANAELVSAIKTLRTKVDVVDVVAVYDRGTATSKTDIVHYDTSTLAENDILKVLKDETHSNQLSYFKFNGTTFTYIGSEQSADVDDSTINRNSSNQLQVKDDGLTVPKFNSTAISTSIPDTGAVDTKLPTEKAVRDELNDKLDKRTNTTTDEQVYIKNADGTQDVRSATPNASANKYIYRDANGRAKIADPVADLDIVNKRYVEGKGKHIEILYKEDAEDYTEDEVNAILEKYTEVEIKLPATSTMYINAKYYSYDENTTDNKTIITFKSPAYMGADVAVSYIYNISGDTPILTRVITDTVKSPNVDEETLDVTSEGVLHIKDIGVKNKHINPELKSTNIPSDIDSASDDKFPTEKAVKQALDQKNIILDAKTGDEVDFFTAEEQRLIAEQPQEIIFKGNYEPYGIVDNITFNYLMSSTNDATHKNHTFICEPYNGKQVRLTYKAEKWDDAWHVTEGAFSIGDTLERIDNRTSSVSTSSTDSQYPTAKAVYTGLETKSPKFEEIKLTGTSGTLSSTDLQKLKDNPHTVVLVLDYYRYRFNYNTLTTYYFQKSMTTNNSYIYVNGTTGGWSKTDTALAGTDVVTTTTNGLMSATDKVKLNGIEAEAQKNTITGVKGNSETSYRTGDVNITAANIGLGNVVNTGDSATPVSGGTTKFTTGGAYTELNKKENNSNKVTSITSSSTDVQYPSAKAVFSFAQNKLQFEGSLSNQTRELLFNKYGTTYVPYIARVQFTSTESPEASTSVIFYTEVYNVNATNRVGMIRATSVKTGKVYVTYPTSFSVDPNGWAIWYEQASAILVSPTNNGLMSSTDKTKLNGIETGATKTIVDTALSSSSTNPLQNKAINAALTGKEDTTNKVTAISSTATDTQYPSALAVKKYLSSSLVTGWTANSDTVAYSSNVKVFRNGSLILISFNIQLKSYSGSQPTLISGLPSLDSSIAFNSMGLIYSASANKTLPIFIGGGTNYNDKIRVDASSLSSGWYSGNMFYLTSE